MKFPRFNRTSRQFLTGMLYRIFASGDEIPADLLRRKIEQLSNSRTTLMVEASGLKGDEGVANQHLERAREAMRDARLDHELYCRQHPEPEVRRGLFGRRRLDPQQREIESGRRELEQILQDCQDQVREQEEHVAAISKRLAETRERLAFAESELGELRTSLECTMAVDVALLLARDADDEAIRLVEGMRQLQRGSLMAGVLSVVVALLTGGPEQARTSLLDAGAIFSQHSEPAPRLLEKLIRIVEGSHAAGADKPIPPDSFSLDGLNRLARLLAVMDGAEVRAEVDLDDPFPTDLWVLGLAVKADDDSFCLNDSEADELAHWAAFHDLAVRSMACYVLLAANRTLMAAEAAGIDREMPAVKGRSPAEPPKLMVQVNSIPAGRWPEPLVENWRSALACMQLFACAKHGPPETLESWIKESYGFEKTSLYWWVLSEVKNDRSLERNMKIDGSELFIPVQL